MQKKLLSSSARMAAFLPEPDMPVMTTISSWPGMRFKRSRHAGAIGTHQGQRSLSFSSIRLTTSSGVWTRIRVFPERRVLHQPRQPGPTHSDAPRSTPPAQPGERRGAWACRPGRRNRRPPGCGAKAMYKRFNPGSLPWGMATPSPMAVLHIRSRAWTTSSRRRESSNPKWLDTRVTISSRTANFSRATRLGMTASGSRTSVIRNPHPLCGRLPGAARLLVSVHG